VDDDEFSLGVIADFLIAEGHAVEAFALANAALKRMEHDRPDVVVTDFGMPELNGGELIDHHPACSDEDGAPEPGCVVELRTLLRSAM
jgi:CheY-like chemotaxis protein